MPNKIKESNISDGAVTSNKIAPGTIAADRLAGSIPNSKLSNQAITVNGTSINLGASGNITAGIDWQSVVTSNTTMVAERGYFVDTSGGAVTMTLPASPSIGDAIAIVALDGGTNAVTVARNSSKIEGGTDDLSMASNYGAMTLVFSDAANGWVRWNNESPDTFITATGGVTTENGDYKIHTFNSSGNFVVSGLSPVAANNTVSYAVIAGGGGGGGGGGPSAGSGVAGSGGGAGGFREGKDSNDTTFTASPLAASGITVSAQTYPITVGAGGSAGPISSPATSGSSSTFATITSAGGGLGGRRGTGSDAPVEKGADGGSGGGSCQEASPTAGGSGNTPPVSPPQGNNGGQVTGPSSNGGGSGGGGAGGAGGNGTKNSPSATNDGGDGGAGVTSAIPGGATGYAGGGGGGGGGDLPVHPSTDGGSATQGGGVGGALNNSPGAGNGTANTGGGGGGGSSNPGAAGGAGGSGVVIIRYKFQG